jgi:hypothetical protein
MVTMLSCPLRMVTSAGISMRRRVKDANGLRSVLTVPVPSVQDMLQLWNVRKSEALRMKQKNFFIEMDLNFVCKSMKKEGLRNQDDAACMDRVVDVCGLKKMTFKDRFI